MSAGPQDLQQENERLKSLVNARQNSQPTICSRLNKYRPYVTGLFSNTWELRFFTLYGSALQYYRTEADTALHPRGHINVKGCLVEWEGKKGKNWTFGVVDRAGLSLVRLSTPEQGLAEAWVNRRKVSRLKQALVAAGCERRQLNEAYRGRSPLRSADVRWVGARSSEERSRGSPTAQQRSPDVPRELASRWDAPQEAGPAESRSFDSAQSSGPGRPKQDYNSDSGMSEVGVIPRPKKPPQAARTRQSMTPSTALHTEVRPSMLSSDRIALTQHSGLVNLMFLVLVAANARLILENILKYGVLVSPAHWLAWAVPENNISLLACWPAMAAFTLFAWLLEQFGVARLRREKKVSLAKRKKEIRPSDARRQAAKMGQRTEFMIAALQNINLTLILLGPSAVVHYTNAEPVPAFVVVQGMIILWLKLFSYSHCNQDYRLKAREAQQGHKGHSRGHSGVHQVPAVIAEDGDGTESSGTPRPPKPRRASAEGADLAYPHNLTIRSLAQFLVYPTLVYQPSYPASSRFRPRWLLSQLGKLAVGLAALLIITEQYLTPTIANSIGPLQDLRWLQIFERVLKLSLPTLYGWIILFYCLFHLWLNILAEVTGFGDREFYKDWWNATTIGDYWRLWNTPVHKWMLRHVYFPAMRHGATRFWAGTLVFAVSAFFHELMVGLPLHMVRCWAFLGVMGQVPLLFVTSFLKEKARSDQVGNLIFWVTFCIIGQPLCIVLYYHDWAKAHRPSLAGPVDYNLQHNLNSTLFQER